MNKIPISGRYSTRGTRYAGGSIIKFGVNITEGKSTVIGEFVTVSITFEEIERLYSLYLEAKKNKEESDKRTEAINQRNRGEG